MKKGLCCLLALMMLSATACGEKPESEAEQESNESTAESAAETDTKKDEADAPSTDALYQDYLSKQTLCTVSKSFRIPEAGTPRDNPNGLAAAVRYDFDGDQTDELVTFTFERNQKGGEDLRVDLLKAKGTTLETADSFFLTEIADMSNINKEQKPDTIYFCEHATLEVVTAEKDGKLYFGVITGEAEPLDRVPESYNAINVFTVEKDAFTQKASAFAMYPEGMVALTAGILPPSLADKTPTDGAAKIVSAPIQAYADTVKEIVDAFSVDAGKCNLYIDAFAMDGSYVIEGGLFSSEEEAFSGLLNEFGLDTEKTTPFCSFSFVAANQADVRTIIRFEQAKPIAYNQPSEYAGIRVTLCSDLEGILGNDSLFELEYADETAYYKELLLYPYYYPEIWEQYIDQIGFTTFQYAVADLNQDGKKEMLVIVLQGIEPMQYFAVFPDKTILYMDSKISYPNVYDNGFLSTNSVGYLYKPEEISIMDLQAKKVWNCMAVSDKVYLYEGDDPSTTITAEESDEMIRKMQEGTLLNLSYTSYDMYHPEYVGEVAVTEDTDSLKYGYQKAYLDAIAYYQGIAVEPDGLQCALFDLNGDGVPEFYVGDPYATRQGSIYTFSGTGYTELWTTGFREIVSKYNPKKAIIEIDYGAGFLGNELCRSFYRLSNDNSTLISERGMSESQDGTYMIDGTPCSKNEFDEALKECTDGMQDIVFESVSDMKKRLQSEGTQGNSGSEEVPEHDESIAYVKAEGGLNMRSGPGTDYEKVVLIDDGAKVEIISEDGEWTKIRYNGKEGWVKSSYLR